MMRAVFPFMLAVSLTSAAAVSEPQSPCGATACHEIRSLKSLPPDVLSYLTDESQGAISDRDGPFNPSDVVDPSRPGRRFVIAAMTSDRLAVEIERGGREHYFLTLHFQRYGRQWVYISTDRSSQPIDDLSVLLR